MDWTRPPFKTVNNRLGRPIKEKDVESYLRKKCMERGWSCEKFTSPGKKSVPDRYCATPSNTFYAEGLHFMVELKAPYKVATKLQQSDHQTRRDMGHIVFVADCFEQVDQVIYLIDGMLDGIRRATPVWLLT